MESNAACPAMIDGSKSADGLGLDHANFILREGKQLHQRLVNVIGALQGTPHCDSTFVVEARNYAVVFDVQLFLGPGRIFTFDNVVGLGPDSIYIAFFNQKAFERIVGAPNDLRLALALLNRKDGRQRIVRNRDRIRRFGQNMPVRVSQQQDRLLGVVHDFMRQVGLVVRDQSDAIRSGNIFCGDDYEFIPGNALAESDFSYFSARNGAPHGGTVEHSGHHNVVDVLRTTCDFVPPFLPRNRHTDNGFSFHAILYTTTCR